MDDRFAAIIARHDELERELQDPTLNQDADRLRERSKEYADLESAVRSIRELKTLRESLAEAESLATNESDPELRMIAEEERVTLSERLKELEARLSEFLTPPDPLDSKDTIVEIRAGAGGDEAGLFAAELFRAYARFAERRAWTTKLVEANRTGIGGYKEVVFEVNGRSVYKLLKYEAGVHRVQRVPETEKSGRVHTSTVTVAVLPEAEETDVELKPEDVKVEATTSSGHGGQSVNTTYSAIRLTHLPTGIMASCQDERSQKQNREKAFRILRARIFAYEAEKRRQSDSASRKTQIGSGDRSEKIRTYNFPQDRLTDHRINQNFSNLKSIMDGNFDAVFNALAAEHAKRQADAR